MPHKGGRELAELLLASRSDLKILFMSGYADDDGVRAALSDPAVTFLQKPFAPSVLVNAVRGLLDRPR
jgi:two-component system cell cycle sensor histidine kinase/response regulator CckA